MTNDVLDEILALQFLIAWAGEGRCEPPRLGWWDTDLVDEFGGGDFFKRLVPRTHAWAALEAAREVARRKDVELRSKAAEPDRMRSIFHLGHRIDRQLDDRMSELKQQVQPPQQALPSLELIGADFDADSLAEILQKRGKANFDRTPGGRRVRGEMPNDLREVTSTLAAALVPFDQHYPHPHFRLR